MIIAPDSYIRLTAVVSGYPAGTPGFIIEHICADTYLVELCVLDDGSRYETIELREGQFELVERKS